MKLQEYLVDDIRQTDFYNIFKEVSKGIAVKAYDLQYLENIRQYKDKKQRGDSELVEHCVRFKGMGDIPWDQIAKTANDIVNQTIEEDSNVNRNIFYIEFNCHGRSLNALEAWSGTVWLEDGSWVVLKNSYESYNDDYVFAMERHTPPIINTVELSKASIDYTIRKTKY